MEISNKIKLLVKIRGKDNIKKGFCGVNTVFICGKSKKGTVTHSPFNVKNPKYCPIINVCSHKKLSKEIPKLKGDSCGTLIAYLFEATFNKKISDG